MKVYSIGREVGCDILINDSTDVVSRRHATLTVTSSGKMTITDMSQNGTYVNGIRISQNVPVPVTRKDNISFAHVARLDWNMVPKSKAPLCYVVILIVAIILVVGGFFGYDAIKSHRSDSKPSGNEVVTDTTKTEDQEGSEKKGEEAGKKKGGQPSSTSKAKTGKQQKTSKKSGDDEDKTDDKKTDDKKEDGDKKDSDKKSGRNQYK